ncbi:MAG: hypothetical protein WAM60_24600, partial [Candidatus Promineifilaceae bacterium]
AAALLTASAVLGHQATFAALCHVSNIDEITGLSGLDTLLRGQLLFENPQEGNLTIPVYLFTHDTIREVVYSEAGDARRRVFHRRALTWLKESGASAAVLAHHARLAGQYELAFQYLLEAGQNAMSLSASAQAANHFEEAHEIRPLLQKVYLDRLSQLYLNWGRTQELAGEYEKALDVYQLFIDLAQEQDDPNLLLSALIARMTVYAAPTVYYNPTEVAALITKALPLAQSLGDQAAEAKILWNSLLIKMLSGDPEGAVQDGEASLALARQNGLREQEAFTIHDLRRAYQYLGRFEQAITALRTAQTLWRELGNRAMLADSLSEEALFQAILEGDYDAALETAAEAQALSEEIGNIWNQSYGRLVTGFVLMERGRFSEALAEMKMCITLGEQAGFHVPAVRTRAEMGLLFAYLGEYEHGIAVCETAVAKADKMAALGAAPLAVLAYLHQLQGNAKLADHYLQAARNHFYGELTDFGVALIPWLGGEIALLQGRGEETAELGQALTETLEQYGIRPFRAQAFWLQARAFDFLGQSEKARLTLEKAREAAEALMVRPVLWQIYTRLAEIETNEETAATYLSQADKITRYISAQYP